MKLFHATRRQLKRFIIGAAGGILLIIGIIAIPYPGPGWLIVFAALAILATEFDWAQRILHYARDKYDRWQAWMRRQNLFVQAFFWLLTCFIVIVTVWLLNVYGYIADFVGLDWAWLQSPLPWY